jgi:DNA-damage-inducible protein J
MAKTLQIRLDDEMKEGADSLFASLGLDTTTAVRMFLAAALRTGTLAFLFNQPDQVNYMKDPMLENNDVSLRKALAEYQQGAPGCSLEEFDAGMDAAIARGVARRGRS